MTRFLQDASNKMRSLGNVSLQRSDSRRDGHGRVHLTYASIGLQAQLVFGLSLMQLRSHHERSTESGNGGSTFNAMKASFRTFWN